MRLTVRLLKHSHRWKLKMMWRERGAMREPALIVPPALASKGTPISDPVDEYLRRPVVEYPDLPNNQPDFTAPPPPTEREDYNEEPVFEYSNAVNLLEAEKQACLLTKTVVMADNALPELSTHNYDAISLPNQDLLMQRYIMQANVWDTTKDKLPKRFDSRLPGWHFKREFGIPQRKIVSILLRNLLRLCETAAAKHPNLSASRRNATEAYVSTQYNMRGNTVQIQGAHESLVSSTGALPAFASEDEVDATAVQPLPDLYPLAPTIDLKEQHFYTMDNITSWRSGFSHPHPHTLFINNAFQFKQEQRNARAIMFLFAHCLATAKQLYGPGVRALPAPVTMQAVMTDKAKFELYAFQLNTADTAAADGIKNMVWMDLDNSLYQKILPKRAMLRNTKYEDYDPAVLKKLMAMYSAGWDGQ